MNKLYKLFLSFFLAFSSLYAQDSGIIRGKVTESTTGEGAIGATVTLQGTTIATFTDIDGEFSLPVSYGKYSLSISYVGFKNTTISDININSNTKEVYLDNIVLASDEQVLNEVVVTAQLLKVSEEALTLIKHHSNVILDGISSAKMKISGDGTAVEAAKRITGVSIEGGKYVYVRGLGDRYTKSTLNGVEIPGLDPDRNSLQMDIFPTSLIDNIMVSKNFTADMPADFTGGLINVETKAFPETKVLNVSFGVGYNPQSNLRSDFLTYDGGKTDLLGFDNGARALPELARNPVIPTPISGNTKEEVTSFVQSFNPELAAKTKTSPVNYSGGITYGDQKNFRGSSTRKFGYIMSLNYKIEHQFNTDVTYGEFQRFREPSVNELRYATIQNGQYTDENVLIGGLAGFAYKDKISKIRVMAMRLQNGEKRAGVFDIDNDGEAVGQSGYIARSHNLEYNQRSLTNLLLSGTHLLYKNKWEIDWKLSSTLSNSSDPDIRKSAFTYGTANQIFFSAGAGGNPSRIWRDLAEINQNGRLDFTYNYPFKGNSSTLKFGSNVLFKERDYEINFFDMQFFGSQSWNSDDLTQVLQPINIFPNRPNSIYYQSGNNDPNPNEYNSQSLTQGYYISNDIIVFQKLKVIAGLRLENFVQRHTGRDQKFASGDVENGRNLENEVVLNSTNLFPSLNFVYPLSDLTNFRLAYAKTIARPSFKELSFAQIIDPLTNRIFNGTFFNYSDWDGVLKETNIDNFDVRLEKFMPNGQLLSVSAFYKRFLNPIELIRIPEQQTSTEFQPRNVGDGRVLGLELEMRKNLAFIHNALKNWMLSFNVSVMESQIDMSEAEFSSRLEYLKDGQQIDNVRQMAGQSPYIVNAGLNHNNLDKGFDFGLFYNVRGSTLNIVGIGLFPDIYTEPFHSLNLGVNKKISKNDKVSINLNVANILNDKLEVVYKSFGSQTAIFSSVNPGRTFSMGCNIRL